MIYDKILNRGQAHNSVVSSVEVLKGQVIRQWTWQKNGTGGLTNDSQNLINTQTDDLPRGYALRGSQRHHPGKA